jgi:hypothetical protein
MSETDFMFHYILLGYIVCIFTVSYLYSKIKIYKAKKALKDSVKDAKTYLHLGDLI